MHQNGRTVFLHLLNDGILRNYNPWEFHGEKSVIEKHMDATDGNRFSEGENSDHVETDDDVDEAFAMLHDMSNARAFDIMNEFESLGGLQLVSRLNCLRSLVGYLEMMRKSYFLVAKNSLSWSSWFIFSI